MKGQWFLVSAVMASSAFLLMSIFLKSYFVADSSKIAFYDENFYFQNIKKQMYNAASQSNCTTMDKNLNEAAKYFREKMIESGYYVYIKPYDTNCLLKTTKLQLLVASDRMVVYENIDPAKILGNSWENY